MQCNVGGKGDLPPNEGCVTRILHCYLTAVHGFRDGADLSDGKGALIVGFCRNNHIADGVEEGPCAVEGSHGINWPVPWVCNGTVFGPFALQLSELSGSHRGRHGGSILDVLQLWVFYIHALIDHIGRES